MPNNGKQMHTKGPWKVTPYSMQVYDRDANLIAKVEQLACVGGHGDVAAQYARDQELANAALIAGAPDLLAENVRLREMLVNVVGAWDSTDTDDMPALKSPLYHWIQEAKNALRAGGGE